MSESTFDWRRLEAPQPAASARPAPNAPTRRAVAGAAVAISAAILVAGLYLASTAPDPSVVIDASAGTVGADNQGGGIASGTVVVDVSGAVARPGVVTLPVGSRVGDAIAAAGGFGPGVDVRAAASLNLAALLIDGGQVVVPARGGGTTSDGGAPAGGSGGGARIDLNRATQAQLEDLPGIGPVTATKIIAAREEAAFTSVEDLRTRKLVGPSTYEQIRDLVGVGS